MFVEAFHRVFKHEYLKGKVNKRVDTCLLHLLKFVRDKAFERLIKLTKGKATSRIKTIQARHKASLTLPKESVRSEGEGVWKVQSEAEKTMYTVRRLQLECAVTDCVLKCHRCLKTCIHTFSCTCPDFLIQNTLCKHIHLVSASTQETPGGKDMPDQAERRRKKYLTRDVSLSSVTKIKQKQYLLLTCGSRG